MGGQNDNCSLKIFNLVSITPIYIYLLICFPKFPPLKNTKMLSVGTMSIQSMKIAFRFTNHSYQ